jgi:tRNA pseudouridine55 synthase
MAKQKKGEPVHGWVNYHKPYEMGSTHAVARLKRYFNAQKAGHAGTLDPLASGVLPIALGEATKTSQFLMDADKDYTFTVQFGSQTNTDDVEGEVVEQSDATPTKEEILSLLPSFRGEVEQLPPQFSAIKIKGEAAYKYARRGDVADIKPRTVTIFKLELTEYNAAKRQASFAATVSKGTYIRAIGRDLGQKLGCFGHISALCRTRVGPFKLEEAVTEEQLDKAQETGEDARAWLAPVATVLDDIPAYRATFDEVRQLKAGVQLHRIHLEPGVRKVITPRGQVVSLVDIQPGGKVQVLRNLNL